jgi:hypothetical protein
MMNQSPRPGMSPMMPNQAMGQQGVSGRNAMSPVMGNMHPQNQQFQGNGPPGSQTSPVQQQQRHMSPMMQNPTMMSNQPGTGQNPSGQSTSPQGPRGAMSPAMSTQPVGVYHNVTCDVLIDQRVQWDLLILCRSDKECLVQDTLPS